MGMIVRNYFGHAVLAYNDTWGAKIREYVLCTLLLRGGLLINLKGKGITLFLLSWVPQTIEASAIALIAYFIYGVPILVAYCIGYTLACIGGAILDTSMFLMLD